MIMKPYTFANGVTLQPGEIVATPIAGVHMDESIYKNPLEFDGFRFSRQREQDGESAKLYAVNTNPDFLQFGYGIHAWYDLKFLIYNSPGRFFAVNSLKLMLALLLLRYDVKISDGIRFKNWEYQSWVIPNLRAEILFRERTRDS